MGHSRKDADSDEKAAKLARVGMELVWGFKRECTRERCGTSEESMRKEKKKKKRRRATWSQSPTVMVVRGKDATRGAYRMQANTQVRKRGMARGRKLREGQEWRPLTASNLDELVHIDRPERDKVRRRSTWIPKKAGQWLQLIDQAASRKRKGPSASEGEERRVSVSCVERRRRPHRRECDCASDVTVARRGRPWVGSLRDLC